MPGDDVTKNSRFFHVGQNTGLIVCSIPAFSFAMAVSGWIMLFADIADMKTALAYIRIERSTQIDGIKKSVQTLETKLQTMLLQLDHLEALTKINIDRLDRKRLRDKLEDDELKIEEEVEQLEREDEGKQPKKRSLQKERMLRHGTK